MGKRIGRSSTESQGPFDWGYIHQREGIQVAEHWQPLIRGSQQQTRCRYRTRPSSLAGRSRSPRHRLSVTRRPRQSFPMNTLPPNQQRKISLRKRSLPALSRKPTTPPLSTMASTSNAPSPCSVNPPVPPSNHTCPTPVDRRPPIPIPTPSLERGRGSRRGLCLGLGRWRRL